MSFSQIFSHIKEEGKKHFFFPLFDRKISKQQDMEQDIVIIIRLCVNDSQMVAKNAEIINYLTHISY